MNETALQALFVPFGEISAVQMPIEYTTRMYSMSLDYFAEVSHFCPEKHKGFGFVIFAEEEDAEAAIDNLNNAEFYGKVIRVNIAKKAKFQPGGGKAVWADADAWNSDKAQDSGSKVSLHIAPFRF